MAMFGLDVLKPGKLGVIMGTSFVHLCLSDEKPDMKGIWGPYDGAVLDNMWLLEGGQISASGLVNWFRHNFHIPEKDGNPYETFWEFQMRFRSVQTELPYSIFSRETVHHIRMQWQRA